MIEKKTGKRKYNDRENVDYGRLAVCKLEEFDVPDGEQPFDGRYVLVDVNTRAFVYAAPLTDEGLEKLMNVKDVKEKERKTTA